MDQFGFFVAAVLGAIAMLHLVWALRIWVPVRDEAALARAVLGTRGVEKMPSPVACLFVAACLIVAAYLAVELRGEAPFDIPKYWAVTAGLGAAAVFLARGVIGLLPAMERLSPEQPFLSLNRRLYSPLCIALGLSFLALVTAYPNWSWRLGLVG